MGEIAIAEASLPENDNRKGVNTNDLENLRYKIDELKDLLKIVD